MSKLTRRSRPTSAGASATAVDSVLQASAAQPSAGTLDGTTQGGTAKADYFKLDDMGMLGTTHMMMLDSNNLKIADLMLDWAGKHVAKAPKR